MSKVQSTFCKTCSPFLGQLRGLKGKPNFLFFTLRHIWVSCDETSLSLIYSFHKWVAPSRDNLYTQRKLKVKWQSNKLLKYIGYCEKYTGFPQRWRPRNITFVKCRLVYWVEKSSFYCYTHSFNMSHSCHNF